MIPGRGVNRPARGMVPRASVTRQRKAGVNFNKKTHKMKKFVITAVAIATFTSMAFAAKCIQCNGTGWNGPFRCSPCKGTGDFPPSR